MALIKCPDCESDISDQAINCLHCGRPIKNSILSAVKADEQELNLFSEEETRQLQSRILKNEGTLGKIERMIPLHEESKKTQKKNSSFNLIYVLLFVLAVVYAAKYLKLFT